MNSNRIFVGVYVIFFMMHDVNNLSKLSRQVSQMMIHKVHYRFPQIKLVILSVSESLRYGCMGKLTIRSLADSETGKSPLWYPNFINAVCKCNGLG